MVFFNYSTMQMTAKVVYYGPGLCGKTTNLQFIYGHTATDSRGEMVSLEPNRPNPLFRPLPIDVGRSSFNTRSSSTRCPVRFTTPPASWC
jgi:GTPase SAR1 family protein